MRLNSKNRKPRSRKAFACLCLAGGLLFLGMVFGLSRYSDMQSCEHRMNELIDFVKEQSSAYVQYNETAVAKALVRGTTAMQELDGLTLDCGEDALRQYTERLWLTGVSVVDAKGRLVCEYSTDGIGYAQLQTDLEPERVLAVVGHPQSTYVRRVQLTAARKIACDAAGRTVARDRSAAREVFDGRAGHGKAARDAADALGIRRRQRRTHPRVRAVHAVVLERAAAVAADRADALERGRGDVHLRREQAQTAYRAGIFLKQAEILRARVDRGIIQPEAADGVPAGEHGGDAVQQTARAVQRLTGFQLRDARKADVRAGGDRECAVGGCAVDPYAVARPVERTRGNGKFSRLIHVTDVGQMAEGFDLAFGAVGARAVSEERIGAVRVDDVALLVHLAAVVCRVRVGEGLHGRVDLRRCGECAAEARDAGTAALAEGRLVLV